jgi:AhpD family alkylhydroperoxidase
MTVTSDITQIPVRLDFDAFVPGFARAMAHLDQAATKELDKAEIDPRLRELIRIRASQLNGCAYCLDMHTKDARAAGETEQRLYTLDAWRETPFFDERERAALEWTEAVTRIADTHVPDDVYERVKSHFSEQELIDLTLAIANINTWNRLNVAFRSVAGSYRAGMYKDRLAAAPARHS